MCKSIRPPLTPLDGEILPSDGELIIMAQMSIDIRLATGPSLVEPIGWRSEKTRLACLASLANSDFPPRNPGGAAARRAS